jgi:hypothetical protein
MRWQGVTDMTDDEPRQTGKTPLAAKVIEAKKERPGYEQKV